MEQLRTLQGGLNLDDSVELLAPDDWSDAFNIITGRAYERKNGEKENVRGTTAIAPPGTVDIIGSTLIGNIRSAEDDLSYLFFYNPDASKNSIVKLDQGVLSRVLTWSGLNFSPTQRINGGGVADGNIYFTDNFNQPRCVNITRYAGGSTPASEEEILHIKRGPQFGAGILAVAGNVQPIDDVQFAYQYQYLDGQLSVISPWSEMLITQGASIFGNVDMCSVGIPASETIPVLVKRVKFLARKGNSGVPFYIGDMDPTFTTGDYPIEYREQSLGIVPTRYLTNSELVPLLAGTSCITKNRAWFADYTEGYDLPDSSDIVITGALEDNPDILAPKKGITHSRNSKIGYGAIFTDEEGRSSTVLDSGSYESSRKIEVNLNRQRFKFQITGTPPAWAKYYSLVVTNDLIKSEFYEFYVFQTVAINSIYVTVNPTTGVETYSWTFTGGSVNYVRLSMEIMNQAGIFYSIKDGDLIIVTNRTTGITYGPLKIRKIVGAYIYIDAIDMGNATSFYDCQIYTPNAAAGVLYYEIMQKREIVGGVMDTTDYFYDGDCIARDIFQPTAAEVIMRQMRYKPNEGEWNRQFGKPFITSDVGQVTKSTFIRHSSTFIPGTGLNGLSEFSSGDEGNVPIDAVKIQKLQPTSKESTDGEVILAICNSDTYSIYVDEARISTNDSQSFLISSTNIIGDIRKQRSGFGTVNPESVFEDEGNVYWWDKLARSYVRYATNGIFPISEYKAVTYFEKQAELNDQDDLVITGYDPFYKLILVTFTNAEFSRRKTIGFSLHKERWISFYGFKPTGYIIGSNKLYSFSNSVIYSHDNVGNFNTFYEAEEKIAAPDTDWVSLLGSWTFGADFIQVPFSIAFAQKDAYQTLNVPESTTTVPFNILTTITGVWTGRLDIQFFLQSAAGGVVSDTWQIQYTGNVTNDSKTVDALTASIADGNKLYVRMFFTNFPSGSPTVKIELPVGDVAYIDNVQESKLGISFNDEPATPKEWKVIQVQSSPNFYSFTGGNQVVATDALRVDITNRQDQDTDIRYAEFEVDENMIYGEIRGDANSTGGVLDGDPIYSNTIQATLTFSAGTYKQIVMAKAGCEPSRGHNL